MEMNSRERGAPQPVLTVDTLPLPAGRAVLRPVGELDLASCGHLRDAIDAQRNGGRAWLVLDMSALTFMDSTGLSVLVECSNKAANDGGRLALAAVRPQPAKVLGISGMDRKLPTYESAGDAIAALAPTEDAAGA